MKTISIGELFTEQQLKQAAEIMQVYGQPHKELVGILQDDKPRFDQLEVDLGYAAYVLEWQRDEIMKEYGKNKA